MKINDIKIGDRFRKDLGNIDQLKQSIQEIGLLQPPTIDENGLLVCGRRRVEACTQLGLKEIPVTIINLQNIIDGEVHENTIRKDFTISERYEIRKALEEREKQKAEERMLAGEPCVKITQGKTRDKVAKSLGRSWLTLEREAEIIEAAQQNPEQFGDLPEKIDSGMKVNYALQMVNRAKRHKNTPELPQGQFDVIYADPPWQYDNIHVQGSAESHYADMTDEEIENLQVPSNDNAMLFLWATNAKLPVCLNVMKKWGFEYKTNRVWIKQKSGNGFYVRGQHELLLIGKKGNIPTPEECNRLSSVIHAEATEHSKKPQIVYEDIEQMYPNRKYLELFARKERQGWTSWGNEIPAIEIK